MDGSADLPPDLDPDWQFVPDWLRVLDRQPVNVAYVDHDGGVVEERATMVVVPQLHAWAARIEQGLRHWDDDLGY
jgi:hypothetical protein